jgi:hypothetical protein
MKSLFSIRAYAIYGGMAKEEQAEQLTEFRHEVGFPLISEEAASPTICLTTWFLIYLLRTSTISPFLFRRLLLAHPVVSAIC